jgi:hypothetical protein
MPIGVARGTTWALGLAIGIARTCRFWRFRLVGLVRWKSVVLLEWRSWLGEVVACTHSTLRCFRLDLLSQKQL